MRVLHVINQFCDSAGAEVSLRQFLTSDAGSSLDNGVAVLTDTRNDFSRIVDGGVELFVPSEPEPSRIRAFRHIGAAIDTFRPDLVHTSLFEADLVGRLAARRHRLPAVSTLVSMPWAAQSEGSNVLQRAKFAGVRAIDLVLGRLATDRFHAVAQTVADHTAAAFRLPVDRFAVVHRGRSTEDLGRRSQDRRQAVRRRLEQEIGRPLDGPLLLSVGREEPAKNHAFLLEIVEDLRTRHPGVILLIAGRRGAVSEDLDDIIRRRQLERSVVRLGIRKDVPDLLATADSFVFPSVYEGAAGAVIEAMALEIPIVGSDIPALRELLNDGRCGSLASLDDQRGFADAVDEALTNSEAVRGRVRAARDRFEEEYELEAVSRSMIDLYAAVLEARHSR